MNFKQYIGYVDEVITCNKLRYKINPYILIKLKTVYDNDDYLVKNMDEINRLKSKYNFLSDAIEGFLKQIDMVSGYKSICNIYKLHDCDINKLKQFEKNETKYNYFNDYGILFTFTFMQFIIGFIFTIILFIILPLMQYPMLQILISLITIITFILIELTLLYTVVEKILIKQTYIDYVFEIIIDTSNLDSDELQLLKEMIYADYEVDGKYVKFKYIVNNLGNCKNIYNTLQTLINKI